MQITGTTGAAEVLATANSASKKSGKVLATHLGSSMRTGTPAGLKAAREKHMATRWSSYVWMLPAVQVAGGVTRRKSAPSSTVAPSLRNSIAMAASRSVSLTRQLAIL